MHAKEHNGAFKSPLRRRVLRKDKTPPEGKQPATEKKKDGEESPKGRHKANPNDRRKTTEVPDTVPGPHSRSGVTDIQNAENLDQRRSMRAGFVQGTVSCLGCGSVRHMLRLCPHVNDDDRTKIWAKWQDKLATHRQLLKKYKKGSPTADKEKYDELSKTYSKSLDKAFAALRVKYNTECGRFTHAQHDLEDRAAAISDQLATHVSLDVFRTASAAVDEAIRLYNVANEEAPDDTPTPALAKPSAVALVSGQKPPLNETAAPSCTTMVQTPTQQQSAQHPGSSAAPAPNQIRSSDQLMYPRPHQPDPAMFRPRPSSVPYGYGSDAQAAAVVLRANAQVPQHAAPSSGI